jgi:hypothetical protein
MEDRSVWDLDQAQKGNSYLYMSTCRHYLGTHFLTLMVKGEEKAKASFEVEKAD